MPPQTPAELHDVCRSLLVDVAGLCIAARHADFIAGHRCKPPTNLATCTAIGHPHGRNIAMAALCNGTAAHGEDFDDTYEGGPAHAGAVVVPAMLAAAERHGLSGSDLAAASRSAPK